MKKSIISIILSLIMIMTGTIFVSGANADGTVTESMMSPDLAAWAWSSAVSRIDTAAGVSISHSGFATGSAYRNWFTDSIPINGAHLKYSVNAKSDGTYADYVYLVSISGIPGNGDAPLAFKIDLWGGQLFAMVNSVAVDMSDRAECYPGYPDRLYLPQYLNDKTTVVDMYFGLGQDNSFILTINGYKLTLSADEMSGFSEQSTVNAAYLGIAPMYGKIDYTINTFSAGEIFDNTAYQPGDVIGDGTVDIRDLVRLKKYIAGITVEIKIKAELTGDGKFMADDLTALRRILQTHVTDSVQYYGRFETQPDGAMAFDWSGSTVVGGFSGTEVSMTLASSTAMYAVTTDYIVYSIDGGADIKLPVTVGTKQNYQLASGLSEGYHYVTVTKATEAIQGSLLKFYGFSYGAGKEASTPARSEKKIWFIGDSITAGFGSDSEPGSHGFNLSEENVTKTYGWLAAKELGASYEATSISGAGVYQDLNGGTLILPNYYNLTIGSNKASTYDFPEIPDVIVINLGSNDAAYSSFSSAEYISKYRTFIANLREKCPGAYFVCAMGPMSYLTESYVQQIVNSEIADGANDISYCRLEYPMQNSAYIGADGHPTAAGHAVMYGSLVTCIKNKLAW